MCYEGEENEIINFFEIANNIHPLLKFTYEIAETCITYLDTEVYKGKRFEEMKILDIKSHIKKTETFQYLPTSSAHPKHTFKNIIIGETIRHIRNNNNKEDLDKIISMLEEKLIDRGYDRRLVRDTIIETTNTKNRIDLLKEKPKTTKIPIALVTRYNPSIKKLGKIIKYEWQKVKNDTVCKKIFDKEPIIAYRRNKNLKEILS